MITRPKILHITEEIEGRLFERQFEIFQLCGVKIDIGAIGDLALNRGLNSFNAQDVKKVMDDTQ